MTRTASLLQRMTLAAALLLPALSPHCLRAQSTPDAASSHPRITKVFYLADTNPQDEPQLMYAVRNGIAQDIHVELDTARGALVVTGTADQVELAQRIISELDRPSKSYRLTYTITDFENGKRIGTQHFSFVVAPGKRTTLKEGDKVPIATGSFSSGNATSQTQFTYLDVGMNFDATLDESSDGFHLKTKVEESSIGPSTNIAGVSEPVVRQTVLESETTLVLSKPLILGTLDIPLTTRHSEVTVVVEPVS